MAKRAVITGDKEIDRNLTKLGGPVARDIIRQALTVAVKSWQTKAKAMAPKKTGELANSLRVRAGKRKKGSFFMTRLLWSGVKSFKGAKKALQGKKKRKLAGKGLKSLFWGAFVNLGTRGHKANPFMRQMFLNQAKSTISTVRTIAWMLIEQNCTKR